MEQERSEQSKTLSAITVAGVIHKALAGWEMFTSDILEALVELGLLAIRHIGNPTDEQVHQEIDRAAVIAHDIAISTTKESGGGLRLGIYTALVLLKSMAITARMYEKKEGVRKDS
ncbi:MAG: hypothetical protein HYT87_18995 [Nitrospirae bacterium]|nr:hypothetical protein [Nitrospirota bacterium]